MNRNCVYPSATSAAVIEELRVLLDSQTQLLLTMAPALSVLSLQTYLKKNGIKHITFVSYHPATNGMAERAVQIVKRGLKKITQGSIHTRLAKILKAYRLTPHSTTGMSLLEMLLGRYLNLD